MSTGDADSRQHDNTPEFGSPVSDENTCTPAETRCAYYPRTDGNSDSSSEQQRHVRDAVAVALHPVRMPDEVAARLRARLSDELTGLGPPGPRRRFRAGTGVRRACVLIGAAAAVGTLVALPLLGRPTPEPVRVAAPTPEDLWGAVAGADAPAGPAADPGWVRACLIATGAVDPAAPLVTSRPYPVAGEPGVLLVLGTPETGRYRLVVVPPDCGPGTGRILADAVIG